MTYKSVFSLSLVVFYRYKINLDNGLFSYPQPDLTNIINKKVTVKSGRGAINKSYYSD